MPYISKRSVSATVSLQKPAERTLKPGGARLLVSDPESDNAIFGHMTGGTMVLSVKEAEKEGSL